MRNERLINRRKELGYSTRDIAATVNISLQAYRFYEQGRRSPRWETAEKIIRLLNSDDYSLIYPKLHK